MFPPIFFFRAAVLCALARPLLFLSLSLDPRSPRLFSPLLVAGFVCFLMPARAGRSLRLCRAAKKKKKKRSMHEGLQLFEEVVRNPIFQDTPIFVFLNKKDLFEQMMKGDGVPLSRCFPDYKVRRDVMRRMDAWPEVAGTGGGSPQERERVRESGESCVMFLVLCGFCVLRCGRACLVGVSRFVLFRLLVFSFSPLLFISGIEASIALTGWPTRDACRCGRRIEISCRTRVQLSPSRPSVRLSVCLTVCLSLPPPSLHLSLSFSPCNAFACPST